MRIALQQELDTLHAQINQEADLVGDMLGDATRALERCDIDLADEVIDSDDRVDALYLGIRNGIEALLARQTPVASDLRFVLAMLEVNMHLERMADYCVTIAKLTKLVCELNSDYELLQTFVQMSQCASEMINASVRCFADRDVAAAESLVTMDEAINDANRRVVGRILDLGPDPQLREWGLRMILVSRCLERIGDHAGDIGEQAASLVTGEFREFTDASN